MSLLRLLKEERGQSVLEIIIGLAVGAILIIGAIVGISVSLESSVKDENSQTASFLTQELIHNASIYSEANWRDFWSLESSPTQYYITPSGSAFVTATGTEIVNFGGVDFTRYFILENVSRDGSGNVEAVYNPVNDDPSTQLLIVYTTWPIPEGTATSTLQKYVVRYASNVFVQTDWVGGFVEPPEIITAPDDQFSTSTNIDITSTGSIKILGL